MPEGDRELHELYQETLLDYYQSGAHKGVLAKPDFKSHGINPVCGDEIELTMTLDGAGASAQAEADARIKEIRFTGHGCVISQASAAMMAEALQGLPLRRAREVAAAFKDSMLSKTSAALPAELEAAAALQGVRRFPIRVKCATLSWNTLLHGLSAGAREDFEDTDKL